MTAKRLRDPSAPGILHERLREAYEAAAAAQPLAEAGCPLQYERPRRCYNLECRYLGPHFYENMGEIEYGVECLAEDGDEDAARWLEDLNRVALTAIALSQLRHASSISKAARYLGDLYARDYNVPGEKCACDIVLRTLLSVLDQRELAILLEFRGYGGSRLRTATTLNLDAFTPPRHP